MTWPLRMARLRDEPDRGSVSVEAVMLIPGVVLLVLIMVFAGRVVSAKSGVHNAAYAAARAASLERSAGSAQSAADAAAAVVLGQASLRCSSRSTSLDAAGFTAGIGQAASVRVDVTCQVPLSDLALPGAPGSQSITASATSPIDRFRQRGGA